MGISRTVRRKHKPIHRHGRAKPGHDSREAQSQKPPQSTSHILARVMGFWAVCGRKSCARMKRCCGDAEACRALFWPHVPERSKQELRAMLPVLTRGGSMAEAEAAGEEACRRYDAMMAKETERETSQPAAPAIMPQSAPATSARVRAL